MAKGKTAKKKANQLARPANGQREPDRADLDDKQWAFVEHYLACWNSAEAARRAGYSEKTARQQGSRLLTNVYIQVAIARRLAEHKLTADAVLSMLAEHARGTLDFFLNVNGSIDFKKARRLGKMHLLKSYSQSDKGERIEIHDPQSALVQLGRALGLFVDKVAPVTPDGQEEYGHYTDEELRQMADAGTSSSGADPASKKAY